MDKNFMMSQLNLAIEKLTKQYRDLFTTDGTGPTYKGAMVKRSKIKKDLYIAKLIRHILLLCPDNIRIDDVEECKAFDRLTEPRRI